MKAIGSLPVLQLVLLLASAPVLAADASGGYDATAVTSGRGEANRIRGYAQCLEDVLVKVTGNTSLIGDERIKVLANGAAAYVNRFKYRDFYEGRALHDEQGSYDRPHYLTVSFSAEAKEKIVASLGKTVWQAPRPTVLVVLNVKTKSEAFVLTDGSNQERAADMRAPLTNAIGKFSLARSNGTIPRAHGIAVGGWKAKTSTPEIQSGKLTASRLTMRSATSFTQLWRCCPVRWLTAWEG
jgi:uncharacterized protein